MAETARRAFIATVVAVGVVAFALALWKGQAAHQSTGIKHDVLLGIQHRLKRLPHTSEFVKPALDLTVKAFEAIVAVFFVLASAAYWIFERDRMIDYVTALVPRSKRKKVRDTSVYRRCS